MAGVGCKSIGGERIGGESISGRASHSGVVGDRSGELLGAWPKYVELESGSFSRDCWK